MHNTFSCDRCKESRKICYLLKLNKARIKVSTRKAALLLMWVSSSQPSFLPRASVSFFFLSSWNIICIFWCGLWTQLYNIFNKKLRFFFKFKEAMQWSVTELLVETVSVVDVWSLWQSPNTQVCVQVYHYSKTNLDVRGYKLNWVKT